MGQKVKFSIGPMGRPGPIPEKWASQDVGWDPNGSGAENIHIRKMNGQDLPVKIDLQKEEILFATCKESMGFVQFQGFLWDSLTSPLSFPYLQHKWGTHLQAWAFFLIHLYFIHNFKYCIPVWPGIFLTFVSPQFVFDF